MGAGASIAGVSGASRSSRRQFEQMNTEIFPRGGPGGLALFASQLEEDLPELAVFGFQSRSVAKEDLHQGLALLLQELGDLQKAHLALMQPETDGVGVLIPDKNQHRQEQAGPDFALD